MGYSDNMNPLYLILPEGKPDQGYCGAYCNWEKTECVNGCVDDKQCKRFKRKKKRSCRVVVKVGVVLPMDGHGGTHFYNLCQGEDCVKAGDLGYWGDHDPKLKNVTFQGVLDDKNFKLYVDSYPDLTEVMVSQNWSFKKPLVAKMTGSKDGEMEKYWYSNLPEPVVILEWTVLRSDVLKRQVILSPKEKWRTYGNLLDDYSEYGKNSENGENDEISGIGANDSKGSKNQADLQISKTGADYGEDATNPKPNSETTEAPRSTKAVEPIVHEGEQGLSISFSHEQ